MAIGMVMANRLPSRRTRDFRKSGEKYPWTKVVVRTIDRMYTYYISTNLPTHNGRIKKKKRPKNTNTKGRWTMRLSSHLKDIANFSWILCIEYYTSLLCTVDKYVSKSGFYITDRVAAAADSMVRPFDDVDASNARIPKKRYGAAIE